MQVDDMWNNHLVFFCVGGSLVLLFWNAITVFTLVRMTSTEWKNNPKFSFGSPNMLNPSKETPQRKSVCACVCPELIPSEGSIVVLAGMRIVGDSFSPVLGLTLLSVSCVANGPLLQ